MDLLRDLIRDLIGIIFPGSLVILLGLWFAYGIYSLVYPAFNPQAIIDTMNSLTVSFTLLVLSYVAGQFLRTYQPKKILEKDKNNADLSAEDKQSINAYDVIDTEEKRISITTIYKNIRDQETAFPYPYLQKSRRLQGYPNHINEFYQKLDRTGFLNTSTFFEICKSVIYEYSPALKEEMLRETALIRLFTGIYFAGKLGLFLFSIPAIGHGIKIFTQEGKLAQQPSFIIALISIILFFASLYAFVRIPKILKRIRQRETNIVYDGFYLLCQRHEVLKDAFNK